MKNKLSVLGLFLFGILIMIGVFYFVGIEKIIYNLSRMNLFYYSLSILSVFMIIFFWALRWKTFIKMSGYEVCTIDLVKNLTVGLAINNITPVAKLGGEPIRAYLLKKIHNIPIRRGLATTISDLTIEFFVSVLIVLSSMILITFYIQPPIWLSTILTVFILLSLIGLGSIIGIYSNKRFISRIITWFIDKVKRLKPLEKTILRRYSDFQNTFRKNLQNKKVFMKALIFGIVMKFFDVMKFFFIFMSIGYTVGIPEIVVIMGITLMLMVLPGTPGNIGIMEGGMTYAFSLMGIPIEIAATAVFLERLLWFWGLTVIGGLFGLHYQINFRTQREDILNES